jgi:hypothetical protein
MEKETLLQQLMEKVGLPEETALKALTTFAGFAKDKFPILGGNIDSYLKEEFKKADPEILARVIGE